MLSRLGTQIRDQWMGALALFLVLSGTAAYAAHERIFSSDIVDDQVRSVDVRDDSLAAGGLAAADLRASSVRSSEVGDDSLTGSDINESQLGQVPSALLGGFGRTGPESSSECDPESTTYLNCALTGAINVPAGARALVLGRVQAQTEVDADSARGHCFVATSTTGFIPNTVAEIIVYDRHHTETLATMGVSPPLPPGSTNFGIDCNQESPGAIRYDDASASVILIASN